VRSTQQKEETTTQEETNSASPPPKKMRDVYIKIHNAADTMHSDQSGRFPATSSRGNQYVMVLVEVDGNYINHQRRAIEKQNGRSDDTGLPDTMEEADGNGHGQTHNPHPRQRSIGGVQSGNQKELRNSIGTARQPQAKPRRKSNTDLQEPLQSSDRGGG
jgi:hypothetical protein